MGIETERLRFPGAFGDTLAAHLDRPRQTPRAYALLAHCFTCSKDLKALRRISRALAENGLAVLRFDFTGLGESEGDFADTNFSSNLADLVAAADFLRNEYEAPRLLIGHSLGGAAVLAAAGQIGEVQAVSTIAAPSGTEHLKTLLSEKAPDVHSEGEAEVDLAGRRIRIKRQLLDDLEDHRLTDAIGELLRPLLIFHSPADAIVPVDEARKIYEAAAHPKSFVSLDGADHLLLNNADDSRFVADVLAAWAQRYVVKASDAQQRPESVERGKVVASGGPEGFATHVTAGPHEWVADEPIDHGGGDAGPNPYDLLLASLGTCTSMTLRMYADHKGWPLEDIEVRTVHRRVHAKDCGECESREGKVDVIERELRVTGALSDEQKQRLVEIADRCPVSRTLTSETRIETRLV